jgi:hypothetical protein
MASLIHALNTSSDPKVVPIETLVSKNDTNITTSRTLVLANGTPQSRTTQIRIRFLKPGRYEVMCNGNSLGLKSNRELENGLAIEVPPSRMKQIKVHAAELDPASPQPVHRYDSSTTYLSDLKPAAAQRGTGAPQPTYRKDAGFRGEPLQLSGRQFAKGLGCAANTVLLYDLNGRFDRFQATVGVDDLVKGMVEPVPSVFFTVHVDGILKFQSGGMFTNTPPKDLDLDVRDARMLMLRVSCNWDDNGRNDHDHGDWANARLTGMLEKR